MSRVSSSALDRLARDLVEDHPLHRHLRLQRLDEVEGDRLALPVLVRREQESESFSLRFRSATTFFLSGSTM